MKLKFLPLCLATLALASCGGQSASASGLSVSQSASASGFSSSQPATWQYLDFLLDGKVRFDIFDFEEGFQLSYGNAAIAQSGTLLNLDNNSRISANKSLTADKVFNLIVVVEKQSGGAASSRCDVTPGIEGDKIVQYFTEVAGDDLLNYDRAYVAASFGPTAKWTKGLNARLDAYLENRTSSAN